MREKLNLICAGTVTDNIVAAFGLSEDMLDVPGEGVVFAHTHPVCGTVELALVRTRSAQGNGQLQLFYGVDGVVAKNVALFYAHMFAIDAPVKEMGPVPLGIAIYAALIERTRAQTH